MRIRRKQWARPELAVCPFFIQEPQEKRGEWSAAFAKKQPLYVELGCGKGGFAARLALENPEINCLAIDIKPDMLGVARRNIVQLYSENERDVDNLLLTAYNVEQIEKILSAKDKVQRIYINFCNPWPRGKHHKRRLTYPIKLEKYKELLVPNGELRFKTDDTALFNSSLMYFEEAGYEIKYLTNDLHASSITDNIETEHEIMFSSQGIKIHYCVAVANTAQ